MAPATGIDPIRTTLFWPLFMRSNRLSQDNSVNPELTRIAVIAIIGGQIPVTIGIRKDSRGAWIVIIAIVSRCNAITIRITIWHGGIGIITV